MLMLTVRLCCKEFCNKYFLRIHKANKHGIYIDEPGLREMPFGLPGIPPEFAGMPLAQMMMSNGMLNPNISDFNKMFAGGELGALPTPTEGFPMPLLPGLTDAQGLDTVKQERTESSNEEFVCCQCSKEFSSSYNLNIHVMTVHQIQPSEERDYERQREKEQEHEHREREREREQREREREREQREKERERDQREREHERDHREREREREHRARDHKEREHREREREHREREQRERPAFDELSKPVLTPESLGLKMDSFQGLTPLPTDPLMNGSIGGGPGGTMFSNMITAQTSRPCDLRYL